MNGKQQAVFWSGLILILVRMYATGQWTLLWQIVSNPGSSALLQTGGGAGGSSGGPSTGNKNTFSL